MCDSEFTYHFLDFPFPRVGPLCFFGPILIGQEQSKPLSLIMEDKGFVVNDTTRQ